MAHHSINHNIYGQLLSEGHKIIEINEIDHEKLDKHKLGATIIQIENVGNLAINNTFMDDDTTQINNNKTLTMAIGAGGIEEKYNTRMGFCTGCCS